MKTMMRIRLKLCRVRRGLRGERHRARSSVVMSPDTTRVKEACTTLSASPPVYLCEDLLSKDVCEKLVFAAEESSLFQRSNVGAGFASTSTSGRNGLNARSARRTSSTILVDSDTAKLAPELARVAQEVTSSAQGLFEGVHWMQQGRMPKPRKFSPEFLQLARYKEGEEFKLHEDAFPHDIAIARGFQRVATVLLYLNSVETDFGGETKFPELDLSVHPKQGSALVFFPSLGVKGIPDARTIHAAEPLRNGGEKWVAQLWIVVGISKSPSSAKKDAGGLSEMMAWQQNSQKRRQRGFGAKR